MLGWNLRVRMAYPGFNIYMCYKCIVKQVVFTRDVKIPRRNGIIYEFRAVGTDCIKTFWRGTFCGYYCHAFSDTKNDLSLRTHKYGGNVAQT